MKPPTIPAAVSEAARLMQRKSAKSRWSKLTKEERSAKMKAIRAAALRKATTTAGLLLLLLVTAAFGGDEPLPSSEWIKHSTISVKIPSRSSRAAARYVATWEPPSSLLVPMDIKTHLEAPVDDRPLPPQFGVPQPMPPVATAVCMADITCYGTVAPHRAFFDLKRGERIEVELVDAGEGSTLAHYRRGGRIIRFFCPSKALVVTPLE